MMLEVKREHPVKDFECRPSEGVQESETKIGLCECMPVGEQQPGIPHLDSYLFSREDLEIG